MKTKKGSTYAALLAIDIEQGTLTTQLTVPMALGTINTEYIAAMIPAINDRITTEKKPGATLEECLERIDHHREQLGNAYVKLLETYQRMIDPAKARVGVADKARHDMLVLMKDKMLRLYAEDFIGEDSASEYLLPDDREQLIADIIAAMKGDTVEA